MFVATVKVRLCAKVAGGAAGVCSSPVRKEIDL